jgi:hypothetical protein
MWSTSEHRCHYEALIRILKSHGGGESPLYTDRCLAHASDGLTPMVAAIRNPVDGEWMEVGI